MRLFPRSTQRHPPSPPLPAPHEPPAQQRPQHQQQRQRPLLLLPPRGRRYRSQGRRGGRRRAAVGKLPISQFPRPPSTIGATKTVTNCTPLFFHAVDEDRRRSCPIETILVCSVVRAMLFVFCGDGFSRCKFLTVLLSGCVLCWHVCAGLLVPHQSIARHMLCAAVKSYFCESNIRPRSNCAPNFPLQIDRLSPLFLF